MLPDPTMATLIFDGMDAPLLERQLHGSESGEIGDEVAAGRRVDSSGARTGQHDVAGPKPHPKAFHLASQPRHCGHRIAEHRVAAALGHHLAVVGQYRIDRLDVDVGRRDPCRAQHEARGRRVVGDGVAECDLPVGDPGVDQFDGGHERLGRGEHVVFGAVRAGQVVGQDEDHLDLYPRVEVLVGLHRDVFVDLHLIEQVPVVRLVDAHHLLHRQRRQAHFVAHHPGTLGDPLPDVDQLDLVGVDDVDLGVAGRQRSDRLAAPLSLREDGGTRVAGAEPGANASRAATEIISPKSPHSFHRGSSARPRQFYNVFYMTAQEFDVVVVGSGGAGMVAALAAAHRGLSTIVIEKAAHYGGSTARSGGGVWIPNNEILQRDGVKDTAQAARTYLHGIIGDVVEAQRIDTYLERGPEMLSFVLEHSPLKMCWVPQYADYYPEAPGGRAGGRSLEPKPSHARQLGPHLPGREPAHGKVPLNVVVMQQDYVRLNQLKRHPRGVLLSLKVGARTMWAKATGQALVGMGRALIGPLRIGLQKAGVPVQLNTALTDLYVEDGAVRGVYVRDTEKSEAAEPQLIRARKAVILGSGGFEHNEQMRAKSQRAGITTEWTVGARGNTGDGILAAEKLGAALDIMEDAWWGPTVPLVGAPWFALSERNSPGSIIVNMSGKRFMNESMPSVEACHHMYGGEHGQGPGPGENIPAWLVFDQQYRDRYIFAGLQPGQRIPRKWLESGVIIQAENVQGLAWE